MSRFDLDLDLDVDNRLTMRLETSYTRLEAYQLINNLMMEKIDCELEISLNEWYQEEYRCLH